MFELSGHVALVTGAGRGIGREIARVLARRGARVAVNDVVEDAAAETVEAIEAEGGVARKAAFDVADGGACDRAVAAVAESLGRIDVLVNNAGGSPGGRFPTPFLETPRALWPAFLDMNLQGVLHCTHAVLPGMIEGGWGRVVTVSSDAARVGSVGSSIYGAAKAAGEGLMRTLSKEVGPHGVTANAVVLGLIDTVPAAFLESVDVASAYPMRRVGTAADVAAGVLYLVSEEAGWVTGHSLVINGGGTG